MECSDITPNFKPIECGNLPINHVMDAVVKELNNLQEKLIMVVLKQILHREPIIEDAKDLTRIYYPGDMMDYDLAYKGSKIGRVKFENKGCGWSITFEAEHPLK